MLISRLGAGLGRGQWPGMRALRKGQLSRHPLGLEGRSSRQAAPC